MAKVSDKNEQTAAGLFVLLLLGVVLPVNFDSLRGHPLGIIVQVLSAIGLGIVAGVMIKSAKDDQKK
ncbi:MAG: hypothetical protein ABI220_00985 [Candidatus Saccharimonadales bacterium]